MPRTQEQNHGPEAMRKATGRDHEEWRAVLAEAGAIDWPHGAIAQYLGDIHGVDAWWAQSITVDFEQACKGRLPGQRPDGTFAVSKTATVPGEPLDALALVASAVNARHGEAQAQNLAASQPNARWRLTDGTRLQVSVQQPNRTGIPVTLTWERLASAEAAVLAKAELEDIIAEARHG